jgi:hypothetical protein
VARQLEGIWQGRQATVAHYWSYTDGVDFEGTPSRTTYNHIVIVVRLAAHYPAVELQYRARDWAWAGALPFPGPYGGHPQASPATRSSTVGIRSTPRRPPAAPW